MKFKNYLGSSNLSLINDFDKQKTKNIVDNGLISDLNSKGFPYFTPIGSVILTNIESIFSSFFSYGDYQSIRLPTAMKTSSLHKGQPLGEQFKSKIMHLTGSLDDHHIMSSPETLFIELGQKEQISHSQLPIKLSYIENLHRQKSNATGTLYPQQISIFGGVSIGNYEVLTKGFVEIDQLISSCLKIIGLPFHKEEKHNNFEAEFFYICDSSREGELMQLPGYSRDKVSAYSLGMYYDYPMQDDFRIRFRNKYNRNQKPYLLSFGLSPSRILHCIFCEYSDDHGYALPSSVRPFELVIIPESKKDLEKAQSIYSKIRYKLLKMSSNVSIINHLALDDRVNIRFDKRKEFSDFIGSPLTIKVNDCKFYRFYRNENSRCDLLSEDKILELAIEKIISRSNIISEQIIHASHFI